MSHCCSSTGGVESHPRKHRCPGNGQAYSEISVRTIAHHIRDAWTWQPSGQRYFLCEDPACEIVYYSDDGSTIGKSQLRTRVGLKEGSADSLLCYCFGVTLADYSADPATRDFVVAQTKAGLCSCDTSNPSGRCCLKDFPQSER